MEGSRLSAVAAFLQSLNATQLQGLTVLLGTIDPQRAGAAQVHHMIMAEIDEMVAGESPAAQDSPT